jgi:hypothetical protein
LVDERGYVIVMAIPYAHVSLHRAYEFEWILSGLVVAYR